MDCILVMKGKNQMKQKSHSEITTYLDCQKKWELVYNKGLQISSPHLTFGNVAHKVLETRVVPDEICYGELKDFFNIKSWSNYFNVIFKELDELLKDYNVIHSEYKVENEDIKGIIDLVLQHKESGRYLVLDYKFSNSVKKFQEIFVDEQLYIYALLFSIENNIDINDIDIGFCSISKKEVSHPRVLANGKLSVDKSQATSYDLYVEKINELGLNIDDYANVLENIQDKRQVIMFKNSINLEMLERIVKNIDNVIKDMEKGYILEKCSYQCVKCEFYEYCKLGKTIIEIKGDNYVNL